VHHQSYDASSVGVMKRAAAAIGYRLKPPEESWLSSRLSCLNLLRDKGDAGWQ
jgi:hypothetical protein